MIYNLFIIPFYNHYFKEMDDSPSSRAIFEKKLRSISSTIKDEFIRKYVLEFFKSNKKHQKFKNTNKSKKKIDKHVNSDLKL